MSETVIALVLLTLALAWSLVNKAGLNPPDWELTFTIVGLTAVFYWLRSRRRPRAPRLSKWLRIAIVVLPAYIAFQLLPLPISVLETLSPARASLARALSPVIAGGRFAPLATDVAMGSFSLFTVLCYIATFLIIREIGWRMNRVPWFPLVPLLLISLIEAIAGICQFFAASGSRHVLGSYTNSSHLAGLLEMILPLPLVWAFAILTRGKPGNRLFIPAVAAAGTSFAVAVLLLVAVWFSMPRAGLLISLCVILLVAALTFGFRLSSRYARWPVLAAPGIAVILLLIALPSERLNAGLVSGPPGGTDSSNLRIQLWQETLPLIAEFPWFGCGLGGYESNFLKYQSVAYGYRIQFAYNDYLQYLSSLGIIGFAILLSIGYALLREAFLGIVRIRDENRRLLVIACTGSIIAAALLSIVDFNMQIPANAMALAWIAGVGSANAVD